MYPGRADMLCPTSTVRFVLPITDAALLRVLGDRPPRRVPQRGPFAGAVLLEFNAKKNKVEVAVESICVAHPLARHHVRSRFGLKNPGVLVPCDPTRPTILKPRR